MMCSVSAPARAPGIVFVEGLQLIGILDDACFTQPILGIVGSIIPVPFGIAPGNGSEPKIYDGAYGFVEK